MKHKGAIIDLDDVLFPTSEYTDKVMRYSVAAMIKQGMKAGHEEALAKLQQIRKEQGSNANNHLDLLFDAYGPEPFRNRIVQSGVSAYHALRERLWVQQDETDVFLKFVESLGYRMCIITKGLENKQWFKIIRMGVEDYFVQKDENGNVVREFVYVLPDEHPDPGQGKKELTERALEDMQVDPARSFVLDDRHYGIIAAKKAGVKYGIIMRRGKYSAERCSKEIDKRLRPDFEVGDLEEAMVIVSELEKKIASSRSIAS